MVNLDIKYNSFLMSYMTETDEGFDCRSVDNMVFVSNNGFAVNPDKIRVSPYKRSMIIKVKDKIKLIDSEDSMSGVIKKTMDNGISIWQGGLNPPWKDIVDEHVLFSPLILVSIEKLDFSRIKVLRGSPDETLCELLIPLVFENTRLIRVLLLGEAVKQFWDIALDRV